MYRCRMIIDGEVRACDKTKRQKRCCCWQLDTRHHVLDQANTVSLTVPCTHEPHSTQLYGGVIIGSKKFLLQRSSFLFSLQYSYTCDNFLNPREFYSPLISLLGHFVIVHPPFLLFHLSIHPFSITDRTFAVSLVSCLKHPVRFCNPTKITTWEVTAMCLQLTTIEYHSN